MMPFTHNIGREFTVARLGEFGVYAPDGTFHYEDFIKKAEAVPNARRNDPATSKAAAAKAPRVSLGQKVLDLLGTYAPAGLTGEEISTRLNARLNSVTPRFAELRRHGLIEENGKRSGQIVWVLAGKAAE
jgi:hypothetical protein